MTPDGCSPSTNRGIWVDIGARGSATSGSAPRVAGAAAVVVAAHPQLTGLQVRAALRRGCVVDRGARPRLALRARRRRRRARGGVAGADVPARRLAGRPGQRDGGRLRCRDPVRRVLHRPPRRRNGGDADRRTGPREQVRRVARSLPRHEAVLRRPHVGARDGRRGLREDHAVSSPHAGRSLSGRRLDGRALLRRAATDQSRSHHACRVCARRRRVLVLRLHALEDAPARPGAPARRSRTPGVAAARSTRRQIFSWRDRVTSDWDDAGQVDWLAEHGVELVRGDGRVARPGVVEAGGVSSSTTISSSPPAPPRSRRPSKGSRASRPGRRERRPRPTRCRRAWSCWAAASPAASWRSSTGGSAPR